MRQIVTTPFVKTAILTLALLTLPLPGILARSEAAPAKSAKASGKKTNGRANLRSSEKRDSNDVSDANDSARETALRKIAITPFLVQKPLNSEVTPQQAQELAQQISRELSLKSYFKSEVVEGSGLSRSGREELVKRMRASDVDAVVTGALSQTGATFFMISKNGERLVSTEVPMRLRLVKPGTLKTLGSEIVDEIVRSVPYRGFLTKEIEDGVFELNIGSDLGVAKGQKFRVFDFGTSDLKSSRIDRGEVEVIEVQPGTSVVETTSNNHQLKPFMKIGFDEYARGMVVQTQTPTRGYGLIGGEMISVSGSSDPQFADRSYNMKSTPGLALGFGWNKTSIRAVLAQARNDDVDLVYTEVVGLYRLWDKTNGFNSYSLSAGARIARFGVTTRRAVITPLESSTSFAPAFDVRWDRLIGGPVHLFVGGNLYYPMFNSGNGAGSSFIFAYGAGGDFGASIDLSQRLSLDFGAKVHFIRRPIEGQSAVQERYSQLFADLIARF